MLWQASGCGSAGRFWLDVPGAARYYVEGGQQIWAESLGDEAATQEFLHTTPLAALCYQRGMLAMHAAACHFPGYGALLLAGNSGAGKSTLLARLTASGAQPLADDLAPVQLDAAGRVVVHSVAGRIRLWPDALQKLGGIAPPMVSEAPAAIPLRAVFWLSVRRGPVYIERVQGLQRFEAPAKLSYNTHIADALLERRAYFQVAAAIASQARFNHLWRPRGEWSAEVLGDALLAELF
jgi:hypothetical protein